MNTDQLETMIDQALAEPDPVLCNLRITLAHEVLSRALSQAIGPGSGANFHSWAVWGSKKAGVTVRQEDLESALSDATRVAGACGTAVGVWASRVLAPHLPLLGKPSGRLFGSVLGACCGAASGRLLARLSRRRAAALVLEGNKLVLDDIGRQTARFCYARQQGNKNFSAEGGELLELAFQYYEKAAGVGSKAPTKGAGAEAGSGSGAQSKGVEAEAESRTEAGSGVEDLQTKHQATYHANCLAILHEHLKLQPYIKGSMPLIVRRCVTKRMLQFEIGPLKLLVSEDVPGLKEQTYPETLRELHDEKLRDFLDQWDRCPRSVQDSAAGDWTRLDHRMAYIVELFRCYHLDPGVHESPYTREQSEQIKVGVVPEGKL